MPYIANASVYTQYSHLRTGRGIGIVVLILCREARAVVPRERVSCRSLVAVRAGLVLESVNLRAERGIFSRLWVRLFLQTDNYIFGVRVMTGSEYSLSLVYGVYRFLMMKQLGEIHVTIMFMVLNNLLPKGIAILCLLHRRNHTWQTWGRKNTLLLWLSKTSRLITVNFLLRRTRKLTIIK